MASTPLIQALQNEALYPHPITHFKLIETHLSWVLLTGHYAYKIKKPLNLGFNDFTTLKKRKKYCEFELSLNQALAPELYLALIPIYGTQDNPHLSDHSSSKIIEYAVKTKQFDQNNLLSELNKKNKLNFSIMGSIAQQCAMFHQKALRCEINIPYGDLEHIWKPIQDNVKSIDPVFPLERAFVKWIENEYQRLKPLFLKRKQNGFIRACHGDLYLHNIALINDAPVIFDCIEFNESFRWIDVIYDIAFLVMDLEANNQPLLSHYFVNQYCEYTADYEGLILLRFYKLSRALIRAKIAVLSQDRAQSTHLIALAQTYTQPQTASLCITFGPSGCGKSKYTAMLPNRIRLRSDVIRKQLAGLACHELARESQKKALYSDAMTVKVYHFLKETAEVLLSHSISVVIDATCLKQWQRALFQNLAHQFNISFTILEFETDPLVLTARLLKRQQERDQSSDASLSILKQQLQTLEPLSPSEKEVSQLIPSK